MTDWTSLEVFYHGDRSDLLLDGVRPLFASLAKGGVPAYFVPHWKLGPHVRLNFGAPSEVVEAALTGLGTYVHDNPSTVELDPEAFANEHLKLGQLEQESGPFSPWQPNNSMRFTPHDRRLHVHGTVEAAELMTDFYSATTESAFEMLAAVRGGKQLLLLAFDVMAASAHALNSAGLASSFVSFRSHAEAFLTTWAEGEGLRPIWDEHYRAHRASLVTRLEKLVGLIDAGTPPAVIAHWLESAGVYGRRAAALSGEGKLRLGPPPEGRQEYDRLLQTYMRRSEFHRLTMGDRELSREVEEAEWFVTRRMTFNHTYLQLTRVGLKPIQRFLLCHLLAGAVEDLYGVSAIDVALREPQERREPNRVEPSGPAEIQERLRMREGVHTLVGADAVTHVVRWPHSLALGKLGQRAKDVLWRLSAGEQNLDELVRGPEETELRAMVDSLRANGWLVVSVLSGGETVYTLVPAHAPGQAHRPVAPRGPAGDLELSKFASVDSDGDGLRLSSPRAGVVVKLGTGHVLEMLDELARHRNVMAVGWEILAERLLGDLCSHGFVVGMGEEEGRLETAQWSPHELRFHRMSRQPLSAGTADQLLRLGPGDWFADLFNLPAERSDLFGGPVIPFPEWTASGAMTLGEALGSRRTIREQAPLTLAVLGEFLRRSTGVTKRNDGTTARPYPNGGAAHELEIYPVVREMNGLAPGVYHYDAHEHTLEAVCGPGPAVSAMLRRAGRAMGVDGPPPLVLVISARFGRVMKTYQAIGYAMTLKHVGALTQTMYLVATELGLAPCAVEAADYDGFETVTGRDRLAESPVGEFVLGARR